MYNFKQPNNYHFRQRTRSWPRLVWRFLLIVIAVLISLLVIFKTIDNQSLVIRPSIYAGLSDYCLDVYDNSQSPNAKVDIWACNHSAAQLWTVNGLNIIHNQLDCLTVLNNRQNSGAKIGLDHCTNSPGQIWLRDQSGYYNPNSQQCLTFNNLYPHQQLTIEKCQSPISSSQIWIPQLSNQQIVQNKTACNRTEASKVACATVAQWQLWQSGTVSHLSLLNQYTDGSSYEEWCADFVSYVYKTVGYPFLQAFDGWDQNNASEIQNMANFTIHQASSKYIAKTGDIGFFSYNGGHVEIVISGGPKPTFVYGNSATIDPTTGNGQMMANTITSVPSEGKLLYYLSPD